MMSPKKKKRYVDELRTFCDDLHQFWLDFGRIYEVWGHFLVFGDETERLRAKQGKFGDDLRMCCGDLR